ncbi:galacturonosyltransferase 11 [Striga asiatica]|uniref:Hexosyltransferase n=1 Tax=Striga asiatica TaxID=4170 RepID=A0A5A7Q2Q0_STRAF|nr:galacturonosyltransferase 11 [Striga asiatica]
MTLAKAYLTIAKEHNNLHLAWELGSRIRSCQLLLSKAAMRDDDDEPISLEEAEPVIKSLSSLIFKAQDSHYDIATTIMTMKSHIQALEERANTATIQGTIFGQLASEAIPKNIECFNIKLTAEWLQNKSLQLFSDEQKKKNSPRLVDNNLYHFCIFSDNPLAVSVVVNSTVSNAEHPKQLVFHLVTSEVKYGAMQAWFISNDFKGATIEVQNIEEFTWLYPKYISLLNHLRFYVLEIYPQLEKTCLEAFHRYYKYLNFSNPIISTKFDPQACGWAFGMNVFDLIAWRRENVTSRYHFWMEKNTDRLIWKLGTLPPGLLTFYGLTEPLDRRWHVLGLGYDLNIDNRLIESAAVIHYNGNMKPWLKVSIARYRPMWEQYVNRANQYLQDCVTS